MFPMIVPPQYIPPTVSKTYSCQILRNEYKRQWEGCDKLKPLRLRVNKNPQPISRKEFMRIIQKWE